MNPYFLNLFANINIILQTAPLFPTFFEKKIIFFIFWPQNVLKQPFYDTKMVGEEDTN